jgi:hypothetical protein
VDDFAVISADIQWISLLVIAQNFFGQLGTVMPFKYPDSDRSEGWFHLKLGGEADDKIERVYLCSSPIDALTMAEIDRNGHKGQRGNHQ